MAHTTWLQVATMVGAALLGPLGLALWWRVRRSDDAAGQET